VKISLTVNGAPITREVEGRQTLVDFLRYELVLTGSHIGCEHGVCGACSVRVDGTVIRGCLMLAAQADGCRVETIEGLAESGAIAGLQRAFRAENALQCGFCTPGMLLTAQELLADGGVPSRATIREHISGNYCRCTGYHAIIDAIESVARARAGTG
jgi:carbon-monoxide dehydrogenase small subunit